MLTVGRNLREVCAEESWSWNVFFLIDSGDYQMKKLLKNGSVVQALWHWLFFLNTSFSAQLCFQFMERNYFLVRTAGKHNPTGIHNLSTSCSSLSAPFWLHVTPEQLQQERWDHESLPWGKCRCSSHVVQEGSWLMPYAGVKCRCVWAANPQPAVGWT